METIKPEVPLKPCEYFDIISGTSAGGLMVVVLRHLVMNINDCIKAYLTLSDLVFQRNGTG